ncbi:hypothetical protein [Sphingomonas jaspsi]|uniref:hypothetical protein n=1 Tax=Sphingomonas jaspsi TaxID=392409 RepID=UPI0004B7B249|nr:hypothetical protein [Sphingomonas jaspsi]
MKSLVPTILCAALLAACGKTDDNEAANREEAIIVRSEGQKALFDLNDLNRAIALKRAITDQGLTCKQITASGFVGRYKNMDVWTATCSDKRQWSLFISANENVQVRLCDDNVKLGLPACVVQPGTEGGSGLDEVNIVNAE